VFMSEVSREHQKLFFCNYLYFICCTCTWYRYNIFIHYQKKKETM